MAMLVTRNLQRCDVSLILYSPCCYSVTAMWVQVECLFDFKPLLPRLVRGLVICFKPRQRVHMVSEAEGIKMYLAKTNLQKYCAIYYTPTLLHIKFFLASIYKIRCQRKDSCNIYSRQTIITRLHEILIQTWPRRAF